MAKDLPGEGKAAPTDSERVLRDLPPLPGEEAAAHLRRAEELRQQVRETIGARLKRAIAIAGTNQAQMAVMLGVSRSTISSWCAGHTQPSLEQLLQACVRLQVSVDSILGTPSLPPLPLSPPDQVRYTVATTLALLLATLHETAGKRADVPPEQVKLTQQLDETFRTAMETAARMERGNLGGIE